MTFRKNIVNIISTLVFCLMSLGLYSQSTNVPFRNPVYHTIDRLEIKSGQLAPLHTSHKAYKRKDVVRFALSLDTLSGINLTSKDQADLEYLYKDNWMYLSETPNLSKEHPNYQSSNKPLLKYFYKNPSTFFETGNENFNVVYHPLVDRSFGNEVFGDNQFRVYNQMTGAAIEGNINNRVHFYTDLQIYYDRHQAHVRDLTNEFLALPGNGTYRFSNDTSGGMYDYFNSEAYIDFKLIESIDVQFGYGKQFLGNGFRSMYLSDFSNNYLYLRTNTNVGVFDYQNIFAEMLQTSSLNVRGDQILPKKYYAAHHFSVNLLKNLNVGIFEGIIFTRDQFELNYLNPVIFYRSIERNLGSPDNVFAGVDFKWNFLKRFSLYGQLGIDELQSSRLISNPNSWAHKYARQIGLKYIDVFGVDHLDLQLEYNLIRPYTYSHRDSSTTYSHYNMPLAHPLGANFRELIVVLRYQPTRKISLEMRMMQANIGKSTSDENWGDNIFLNYLERAADELNTGEGVATDISLFDFWANYMLAHNIYIDLHIQYRNEDSEIANLSKQHFYYAIGVKYNLWRKRHIF